MRKLRALLFHKFLDLTTKIQLLLDIHRTFLCLVKHAVNAETVFANSLLNPEKDEEPLSNSELGKSKPWNNPIAIYNEPIIIEFNSVFKQEYKFETKENIICWCMLVVILFKICEK